MAWSAAAAPAAASAGVDRDETATVPVDVDLYHSSQSSQRARPQRRVAPVNYTETSDDTRVHKQYVYAEPAAVLERREVVREAIARVQLEDAGAACLPSPTDDMATVAPALLRAVVRACESVATARSLSDFQAAMRALIKRQQLHSFRRVRAAMDTLLTEAVMRKIEAQVCAFGPTGTVTPVFTGLAATAADGSPAGLFACLARGCAQPLSWLRSVCTSCGCHRVEALQPNAPPVDWRPVVQQHAERCESAPKAALGGAAAAAAFAALPQPTALWLQRARESVALRAIEHVRVMAAAKSQPQTQMFDQHGGDIIFLLRHAAYNGRGRVAECAYAAVREMERRFASSRVAKIGRGDNADAVMNVSEVAHARLDLDARAPPCISPGAAAAAIDALPAQHLPMAVLREQMQGALASMTCDEVLRFDARKACALPVRAHCDACSDYDAGATCTTPGCDAPLRAETDYEQLYTALVWTSVYRDLGLDPVRLGDAEVSLADVLGLLPLMRPYRSLESLGRGAFTQQCYFITHLVLVLSQWGRVRLEPRARYAEEYLFLTAHMPVAVWLEEPELVGEFVHALHILGARNDDASMQQGRVYLMCSEGVGTMAGNWVSKSRTFHKRYHTAYCGLIGVAEFGFDEMSGQDAAVEFRGLLDAPALLSLACA